MNASQAEVWKTIAAEYNAQSFVKRTLQQLQGKYNNIKAAVRKAIAAQRLAYYGTGGGHNDNTKLDPVPLSVLELLNEKTVNGLQSQFGLDVENYYQATGSIDLSSIGFYN